MSDILAAIGIEQMKRVEDLHQERRWVAGHYNEAFWYIEEVTRPERPWDYQHTWQMYTILLDDATKRNDFVLALNQRGIGASVHFDPPVHQQKWYSCPMCEPPRLPITDDVASRIVTLPIYPSMTSTEMMAVVDAVKEVALELL